jgi:hypothetical protein
MRLQKGMSDSLFFDRTVWKMYDIDDSENVDVKRLYIHNFEFTHFARIWFT